MSRESAGTPEQSFYLRGLLAGIAARNASKLEVVNGVGDAVPPDGEAPEPAFNLASKLVECAAEDRAPAATERPLLARQGLLYLGPEKDGFEVQIAVPDGRIDALQLLGLAAVCQQFANGSVEFDEWGNASLRVVSVCAAPEALRRIESIGLKTAHVLVEPPVFRRRLLSGEMESLAESMKGKGLFTLLEIAALLPEPGVPYSRLLND